MRNYLYIWNDLESNSIITSGIEFKDLLKGLSKYSGIYLLRHDYFEAKYDKTSRFDYVDNSGLSDISEIDVHSFGDFVFVDFSIKEPIISKQSISEMLYFSHMAKPFGDVKIPELNNDFLFWSHDDGYLLRIFYTEYKKVIDLLESSLNYQQFEIFMSICHENKAILISSDSYHEKEKTLNIDSILRS